MDIFSLSGASLVLFLDAVLSSGCSLCIFIGLWPFRGLFHAWFYKHVPYTWTTHTMMGWFDVGCIGLLTTNTYAFLHFKESTGQEAFNLVYTTNAVMHFLWGVHNLHLYITAITHDKGTANEWRRPYIILLWSILGACGSGCTRNVYSLQYGPDDTVTKATWVVEWGALGMIVLDLLYHLVAEHSFGMAMARTGKIKQ